MKFMTSQESWKTMVVLGIISLSLGIVALLWPKNTLDIFVMILGVVSLIGGLYMIYESRKMDASLNILFGVIGIVLGIILLAIPSFAENLVIYILAIFFAIYGIMQIADSNSMMSISTGSRIVAIIIGVLFVVLAVVMIAYTNSAINVIMMIIGAFLLVNGVLYLVGGLQQRKSLPIYR